ncbi:MAG: diguanylate cyclase (GGDEF)-like protein, partial [Candidatus Azotimanducaceae bacterium]
MSLGVTLSAAISLPHGFTVHYDLSDPALQDAVASMPFALPRVDGEESGILVSDNLELMSHSRFEHGILLDTSLAPVSAPERVIVFPVEPNRSFLADIVALVTTISQGNVASLLNMQRHYVKQMVSLKNSLEEAVVWTDDKLKISSFTDSAALLLKQRRMQLTGQSLLDVLRCEEEDLLTMLVKRAAVNATDKMELEGQLADGSKIFLMVGIRPVAPERYQLNLVDVSSQRAADKRFMQLVNYDPMTGLANRGLLFEFLHHAIGRSKRSSRLVALMVLDLNPFNRVSDDSSAQLGDELIKSAASRIKSLLQDQDMLARWGGDELAIVIEDLEHPEKVSRIAQQILSLLSNPFVLEGRDYYVSPSMGIAVYPEADETVNGLIQAANTAMFEAKKEEGRNTYRFYQAKLQEVAEERARIERGLLRALENDEFSLAYQPKVSISHEKVTGFEALLRWDHPEWKGVSPQVYIPIAEECGLIGQIGDWVLNKACHQMAQWQADYPQLRSCSVAVNVSTRQLTEHNFADRIASILEETSLDVERLEIEITESSVMEDPEQSIEILNKIHDLGVKVSIDDFGTGYSSLSYLKKLPIDCIKIDRSFVTDIGQNESTESIIQAILVMSSKLGLYNVAEGIETTEQLSFFEG